MVCPCQTPDGRRLLDFSNKHRTIVLCFLCWYLLLNAGIFNFVGQNVEFIQRQII
ncbi:hypothetical protein BDA96_06G141400 [Sorghum bicolor]|uniref:Uncharacterized protein n=1 Tax=Sorghum bicolor TaxID=4558 RepID=A0A921QRE8_SORBI|nr:hypothetical protein BDA96_06G141400 [Sorghum bicolor]